MSTRYENECVLFGRKIEIPVFASDIWVFLCVAVTVKHKMHAWCIYLSYFKLVLLPDVRYKVTDVMHGLILQRKTKQRVALAKVWQLGRDVEG